MKLKASNPSRSTTYLDHTMSFHFILYVLTYYDTVSGNFIRMTIVDCHPATNRR